MKTIYSILVCSVLFFSCQKEIEFAENTSEQEINTILDLADDWEAKNIDSALYYSQSALELSLKNKNKLTEIKSRNNIGFALLEMGKNKEAMSQHQIAMDLAKEIGDSSQVAKTLNFIGRYYNHYSDYDTALKYFLQSYELRKKLKDTLGMGIVATNIGLDFYRLKQYDLAEKYMNISKEINLKLHDTIYYAGDQLNLALVYKDTGRVEKAIEYNSEALKTFQKKGDEEGVCLTIGNLGRCYLKKNEFQKAQEYFVETMKMRRNMNKPKELLWAYVHFMDLYHNWGKNQLSIKYADSAIMLLDKFPNQLLEKRIYESKADSWSILGNTVEALTFKNKQIEVQNVLNSEQRINNISSHEVRLNVLEKENKILKQNAELIQLSTANQIKNQWMIIGGLTFLGLFTTFYFWRSKQFAKRKAHLQKVFAQDLIRNVEDERKRISGELHDSVGQSLLLIKNKVFLENKEQNTDLIDQTIDEVRSISQSLHPFQFEKLGLIKSIESTVENFQNHSEIFYSIEREDELIEMEPENEILVYRMIQESLNNVEKHSKATACQVKIEKRENEILFQVRDNGQGFDVTENAEMLKTLGMKTLKERAQIVGAKLIIDSEKGKGTLVKILVPIKK